MYVSGWNWWPGPVREIYDVQMMLQTPDYSPTSISCIDNVRNFENIINPGIKLFGCLSCEEFLEKHESIFEDIYTNSQIELFNKNRSEDILLKHFIERYDVVEYQDGFLAESLLRLILQSDRKKIHIHAYENGTRRSQYDQSLYSLISGPLNAGHYDATNFNHVIGATVFHFVDSLQFDKINLSFEIYSDLGDLNISMIHEMLPCDRLKQMNENNVNDSNVNQGPRYKIDMDRPIKITCSLLKNH